MIKYRPVQSGFPVATALDFKKIEKKNLYIIL